MFNKPFASLILICGLPFLHACSTSNVGTKTKHARIPSAGPLLNYPTKHRATNKKYKRIRLASGKKSRQSSIPAALPLRRIKAKPNRVCPTPSKRIRRVSLASAPKRRQYRRPISNANTQQRIAQQQRLAQQRTQQARLRQQAQHRQATPRYRPAPQRRPAPKSPQLNTQQANAQLFALGKQGSATQISRLISQGAQVNSANSMGETALHAAASSGNSAAAQALIQHGANVNSRTVTGWTPLHTAARFGKANIVTLLLSRGAQRHSVNRDGKTPSNLAAQSNHQNVVNIIR